MTTGKVDASPPPGSGGRNLGLDIVRAAAIALVLICHSDMYLRWTDRTRTAKILYVNAGIVGVELFFVLSGFLIGRIIIREVFQPLRPMALFRFWVRRWFRTLPPYYLVVLLLVLLGSRLEWRYLVFLQTARLDDSKFFPVSWSLVIEEWFYLLVPILLLITAVVRIRAQRAAFFLTGLGIVAASILARWYFATRAHPAWDFTEMRVYPLFRMDTMMIGVMLAGIEAYFPVAYGGLRRRKTSLFVCGAVVFAFLGGYQLFRFLAVDRPRYPLYSATIYFPLLSVSIALIILALESSRWINERLARMKIAGGIRFLSLTSYSAYLTHDRIYDAFRGLGVDRPWGYATALRVAAISVALAVAYALYRWFEKPVLVFRDRLTRVKSN